MEDHETDVGVLRLELLEPSQQIHLDLRLLLSLLVQLLEEHQLLPFLSLPFAFRQLSEIRIKFGGSKGQGTMDSFGLLGSIPARYESFFSSLA